MQFIIGIVLARLLMPAQFGLIGMLAIFMAVAQSFLDSGFGTALVQKRDATQTDTSSIFYFNIVVGLAAAGLLCLVAPWIAAFYNQPILTSLTRAMSLVIVIGSFGLVQSTLLTRQLNFKSTAKITLVASVLSGILGITLAALGFEVWSLVIQQISASLFSTILLWCLSDWRPALIFSVRSLREMFGFGSRVLASALVGTVFDNLYSLVIGKLFSASELGFYTRAQKMQELSSQSLTWTVGRVIFPVFSTIQDDRPRIRQALRKVLTLVVLINFPLMIGLLAIARPLVAALLTEKWIRCVPYLQLLCMVGMLYPLSWLNANVLYAMGRSDLCLRMELIKRALMVVTIAVTWPWGIVAMIYGQIGLAIFSYGLSVYYNSVVVGYPIGEQLADLLGYLPAAVLMGSAVYIVGLLPFPNVWFLVLTQISTGVAVYISLCRWLRLPAFLEVWQMAWKRVPFLKIGTA